MKKLSLIYLLGFCLLADSAFAASADTAVPQIPAVTRLVQLFTNLEISLIDAQLTDEPVELGALLTDNFEMRVDTWPGTPIARAEWIKQILVHPLAGQPEQMAVHDEGAIAIVSFLLVAQQQIKQLVTPGIFIVDIWKQSSGGWKLSTRYAASAYPSLLPVPGAPAKQPIFEKRY